MTEQYTSQTIEPSFVPVGDRAQQLDMLLHLQEFSSMVVLLTGPAAVGKSAMLNEAQQQLQVHHQVVGLSAHKMMGEADLFQHISESLGCSASEAGIGLALDQASKQQETVHVLVDDAHLLEAEALQYLVEVAASERGWHLILAGDERIESQLRILQARIKRENLFHTLHIPALSEEETQIFLADIYRQMGQDTLPLSQQRIHQLWALSEGLPGKILDYIEVETEKASSIKGRIPYGHVAAMLLVGVALYFSYSFKDDGPSVQDPIAALLNHEGVSDDLIASDSVVMSDDDRLDALLRGASVPTSAGIEQVGAEASSLSDDELSFTEPADELDAQTHADLESEVEPTPKALELTPSSKSAAKPAVAAKSTQAKPASQQQMGKAHPLLAAEPKTYALQLLGVRKSQSAEAFKTKLASQIGGEQISVYETRYKSAPWYVVVYGPFDDRQAATNAVKNLPQDMQKQRPWVRQLSKIQEDILKAK